ncbi:uncharacterized protein LOC118466447 isoform X8 [Anopheles albimanus]|uniref:uncharacterized protein LOC118466447 isoform X8 n=1 Tax=Anopheles albimanus TaxID=7167 RepID=UPI00163F05F9|nr:uncharacterized protein LOC118466447 isoform X8 [Anopheles albimanus]
MSPADLLLGTGSGLPGAGPATMKLSPGVGVTLLIGVAGSIFLASQTHRLLRSKLSQRRRASRKPDVAATECYMCNANIELERPDSFATCRGCERLVCRGENCCQWVESIGIWECGGCQSNRVIQQKAGEWLLNQLTARLKQPGPVELKEGNLLGLGIDSDADTRSTVSVGSSSVSVNQRIKVREFIEELLSTMLHGSLDDVSVGQLMKNDSYIRVFRKFHTRLSRCLYNLELSIHQSLMADLPLWEGQQQHHSPSDQHFELKQLVQKILEEIAKLPELLNHSGLPLRPEEHLPYFDPKKYEQLLATAVLNKVVDDYRNPKNFVNVSTGDVAGKVPGQLDINHNKVPVDGAAVAASQRSLLNEGSLRQMSVAANVAGRDPSSREPDDDDEDEYQGERRLSDTDESYLSDYIQRHKVPLPDLSDTTGSGSGAEDDDLQSLKSNATDGTWEENWLFRKRQLKTTESSIAMLVPSPTEEVKALIGDKNADEISDLSEAGSDCEAGYESDGKGHDSSPAGPVSKESTSEAISSSSKANDDSLDEQLPPDSLVSVNSLPGTEALLSEAKNSQLLGEQSASQGPAGGGEALSLMDDLISIGPVMVASERVETKNTALTNPFLDEPFEPNNNVITDDVKLLQRTNEQATNDLRSSQLEPTVNGSCNRKEIPIDRAQIESAAEPTQLIMSNGGAGTNGHHTATDEQQQQQQQQVKEKEQEPFDREETLIPGSIAEREHLKWRNAKPIANNPYSPDALQRRLSEKSRPSSMIEIDRLVRKEAAPNGVDDGMMRIGDDDPSSDPRTEATIDQERSAKVCASSEQKKIGREYYINDPERLRAGGGGGGCVKQTLGTRTHAHHQQSHSTDDEKSLLLGRNPEDSGPADDGATIFVARPVHVTPSEELRKGSKGNALSEAAREVFLLPLEPDTPVGGSLLSSASELSFIASPTAPHARQEFDSLTYSEDSDVTRIYDLTTGEAKVIRTAATPQPAVPEEGDKILEILPQHPPASTQISDGSFLRAKHFAVKPLSPETIKFFAPKRKLSFTGSHTNLAASDGGVAASRSTTPAMRDSTMHSSMHADCPVRSGATEYSIIEREVIDVLPSVKELAKCYSGSTNDVSSMPPKPLYKPRVKLRKDFLRQSSDVLNEETVVIDEKTGMPCTREKGQRQYCSTSSIAVRDEIREIRKINLEAYRQAASYYPMAPGHSITARSLSKQIREHKSNVTDDHKVVQHHDQADELRAEGAGSSGDGTGGHISPERPSSPVLLPGHLKSSIEFFESLKNRA